MDHPAADADHRRSRASRGVIRANLDSGKTVSFDLSSPVEVERWSALDPDSIRAVSIVVREADREVAQFVCPRPSGVRGVRWAAELVESNGRPVREVVTCYGDQHSVTLSVFLGRRPIVSRVDWTRAGRLRLQAPN